MKIIFSEKECVINYEEYIFNTIGIKCSNILNENDINLLISWLPNKPSAINLLFDTVEMEIILQLFMKNVMVNIQR